MSEKTEWGYVIWSVIGALVITLLMAVGLNYVQPAKDANPQNLITTSGGLQVKMGKVTAELAQTQIKIGSGGGITVPIGEAGKNVKDLMDMAGVQDTSFLKGNLTVCLATVVAYKTELNGMVSTKIMDQCRNFTPGMMASTINTFAEGYTVESMAEYRTNYTFINKESK